MWKTYFEIERKISLYLKKRSIFILRYALGIIYFWYGLLKVLGISPAEALVIRSTEWLKTPYFLGFLGLWEIAIGFFLFFRRTQRIGLWLLFLQLPGTFLPIFFMPDQIFTHFPYGLTVEGQYVFKNFILVAAALVLVGALHNGNPSNPNLEQK